MTGRSLCVWTCAWTLATAMYLPLVGTSAQADDGPLLPGLGESPAADPVFDPEPAAPRSLDDRRQRLGSSRNNSSSEQRDSEPNRLDQLSPPGDRQPASRLTRPQQDWRSRDTSRTQTEPSTTSEPQRDPRMLRQTPRSAAQPRTDAQTPPRGKTYDRGNSSAQQRDQYRARQEFERRQALERMQRSGNGQPPANANNRTAPNGYQGKSNQGNTYQANPNQGNQYQGTQRQQPGRTGAANSRPARPKQAQEPPAVSPWERDAAERATARPARPSNANSGTNNQRSAPRTTWGGVLRRR